MKLQERLNILENELQKMIDYRNIVTNIGSTIDYTGIDFERESMIKQKIMETKELINNQDFSR